MSHDHQSLDGFNAFRAAMNEKIFAAGNLTTNRFFNLDTRAYEPGALDVKTKEMLGLVASLVLRCDDCISYHVIKCAEVGATDAEIHEVFSIGLVVGGSIVIPHLRRAVARLEEVRSRATP
ncbi:MAG: carboxymuconolactone decarboxylase family protein [Gemmatimonadetes bacterium]|nr:carboxymuconolactone decarboxylase family protein [Gemmatimonadota bacterium]